ncbi:MAG: hypothetical protein AAF960_24025 [Bacteroidota bacterium]
MKNWITILFVLITYSGITQHTFWVESIEMDSLVIFNIDTQGIIINRKKIPSTRIESSSFIFEANDTNNTFIQPYCKDCPQKIEFTIMNMTSREITGVVKLKSQAKISIQNCFESFPPKSWWENLFSPIKRKPSKPRPQGLVFEEDTTTTKYLANFLRYNQNSLTNRRRTPILRGGDTPSKDSPKIYFGIGDYSHYWSLDEFAISFQIFENYPIKSIYILSHDGELIFASGSTESLNDIFDFKGKKIPSIGEVLLFITNEDPDKTTYLLQGTAIKSYLMEQIQTGKFYQIGIQLENDESDFNPYLFNFQLISTEEKEVLINLFDKINENK